MLKTKPLFFTLIALFVLIAAGCSSAPISNDPQIMVKEPRARAAMPNGAIYMKLVNAGGAADALISVDSDVADAVEIHESSMDENQVMHMRPVEKVEIPAGGSVTLKQGGLHVMLIGVDKGLAKGDKFKMTLNFEKSPPQTLEVEVTDAMAMDNNMEHGDEGDMDGEGIKHDDDEEMDHN